MIIHRAINEEESMTIRITVPADLEESIVAWAEEAGVEPSAMALKVLSQGVSRRRNLSTYAEKQAKATKKTTKRGPGRPKKEAAEAPKKRGRPRKDAIAAAPKRGPGRPKKDAPKPRAVAKALAPKKVPAVAPPAEANGAWHDVQAEAPVQ